MNNQASYIINATGLPHALDTGGKSCKSDTEIDHDVEISSLDTSSQNFEIFPKLAPELRCMIWKLTANIPSVVDISCHELQPSPLYSYPYYMENFRHTVPRYTASTPIPSLLHVNKEAREEALKEYSRIPLHLPGPFSSRIPHDKPHYVYVNVNVDEIHLRIYDTMVNGFHSHVFHFLYLTGLPRTQITNLSAFSGDSVYHYGLLDIVLQEIPLLILWLKNMKVLNLTVSRSAWDDGECRILSGTTFDFDVVMETLVVSLLVHLYHHMKRNFEGSTQVPSPNVPYNTLFLDRDCTTPENLVINISEEE